MLVRLERANTSMEVTEKWLTMVVSPLTQWVANKAFPASTPDHQDEDDSYVPCPRSCYTHVPQNLPLALDEADQVQRVSCKTTRCPEPAF
jgi:hypothetical protein